MNRILFIRHGTTDLMGRVLYGRMPGVHLNAEGYEQAKILSQGLKQDYEIDRLISSPMERALETARPIAEAQNQEIRVDENITEIDVGRWAGLSFEELASEQEWRNFNRQRSMCRPPGGESMMCVQDRAWQCVSQYLCRGDSQTLAFVTHGDVIRCLLLLVLGLPIDHIHRIEISPASVTEIAVAGSYPILKRMNHNYRTGSL